MKNKYGAPLDGAGYAPSIMQFDPCSCYKCGSNGSVDKLDRHEVFSGPYRKKSKQLGLWVMLCHWKCHIFGEYAIHANQKEREELERAGQRAAMAYYHWTTEDFIREFGRNYL